MLCVRSIPLKRRAPISLGTRTVGNSSSLPSRSLRQGRWDDIITALPEASDANYTLPNFRGWGDDAAYMVANFATKQRTPITSLLTPSPIGEVQPLAAQLPGWMSPYKTAKADCYYEFIKVFGHGETLIPLKPLGQNTQCMHSALCYPSHYNHSTGSCWINSVQ